MSHDVGASFLAGMIAFKVSTMGASKAEKNKGVAVDQSPCCDDTTHLKKQCDSAYVVMEQLVQVLRGANLKNLRKRNELMTMITKKKEEAKKKLKKKEESKETAEPNGSNESE